ncbi:histone family protein DNA-binding protein [Nitrosococcus halophilus Nc 4]|uniref:Histone family protein DNA-binding protein n=1 Tax=Nitrosococcus halophilus (strain Nc4) TaxID=472759 RepID=D5BX03_NITHN|nr:HU family DNA-binding protein [Nitrosococcus halophilus]ADE13884.1 histone family protein DNA-binding protein [Nitrosococcus halophilus Nc 4]
MKKIILSLILMMVSLSVYGVGDKELAGRIAKQTGMTPDQVEEILAAFKKQVIADLTSGQEVRLSHFGKFYAKHMDAREARNPRTGEIIQVPPRSYLRFRAFDTGHRRLN